MVRRRRVERSEARTVALWDAYRRLERARWGARLSRGEQQRDELLTELRGLLDPDDLDRLVQIVDGNLWGSTMDNMLSLAGPEPRPDDPEGEPFDPRADVVDMADWYRSRPKSR